MTVQEIVESGVELGGGDQSLHVLVKRLLNAWIKHEVTLFPYLLSIKRSEPTTSPQLGISAGQTTITSPPNYYRVESVVFTNAQGVQLPPLANLSMHDWDNIVKSPTTDGDPRFFYVNHQENIIEFYPRPNKSYTYYIRYKALPTEIDATGNSDDNDSATEANLGYPDPMTLVRVCKAFTLEWRNQPEMAMLEWQMIQPLKMETNRAALDNRRQYKRQRLSPSFFNQRPYAR